MAQPRIITYEDDYFNIALPTPQQGEPIIVDDAARLKYNNANDITLTSSVGSIAIEGDPVNINDPEFAGNELYTEMQFHVEEMRRAAALQKFVEAERSAQTYQDFLKVFYNVNFPDHRAQEPEYIGGTSQPVKLS